MQFFHKSVLLKETIDALDIKPNGVYIDGTAGAAGHSIEIAKKLESGRLISIDRDPDAIKAATERLKPYPCATVINSDFAQMDQVAKELNITDVDGVLLDLGVSSYQLDDPQRGFSYHKEGLLDMRMSKKGISAYDIVNTFSQDELTKIIYQFGEEQYAKSIAKAIVLSRQSAPITTTAQLVDIIKYAFPPYVRYKDKHPARKTFQAIRIAVNDEIGQLTSGLKKAFSLLKPGGRLAVITFHSIEDRIVKQQMAYWVSPCTCPPDFPKCICGKEKQAQLLFKKPVQPSQEELSENKRSRSAKLRVCVKI